jgi:RHS repeat-associated protein
MKRYRYTGKERDEETGLYYHGARYYIPWLARWATVDPLQGEMPEWSSYNYGYCNPIIWTDVTGMEPEDVVSIPKPPTEFKADEQDAQGKKQSSTTSDSDIITGTALYTTKGDYLGRIKGDMSLEIHFIDVSKLPDLVRRSVNTVESAQEAIDAINQLSSDQRDEFATAIRSMSEFFIGKKSAASLKAIALKSAKMGENGTELGFFPAISASRELIFNEFEVPPKEYLKQNGDPAWDSRSYPMEATLSYYSRNYGDANALLGYGHTHAADYYNAPPLVLPYNKWDRENAFSHYGKPSLPVDYKMLLNRPTPLFIANPLGFTVYRPYSVEQGYSFEMYKYAFFDK